MRGYRDAAVATILRKGETMKFQQHMIMAAVFAFVALGFSTASWAQGDEEQAITVESLKQGQDDIRKELAEIKKLLQQGVRAAAPSGPNVEGKIFNLGDNPYKGDGKVALIEFTPTTSARSASATRKTRSRRSRASTSRRTRSASCRSTCR